MYKISKVVNNNIVCSVDSDENEIIIRGLGIGFKKQIGEPIPDEKIEKIYKVANEKESKKVQQLFCEIPIKYIEVCSEIIDLAKNTLCKKLNKIIHITLTDHIDFADVKVTNGQKIKKGDLLANVDLEGIAKEGYRTVTPVIVTNSVDFTVSKN